ncbi:MAG: membrane protein insertase YidC [Bacteroidales bacterium]|nr:membrane protein insertase YidC [Bacteroidales bacterium]
MDKNTIIGLLLIFALFMGFSFYTSQKNAKHREQVEKEMLAQEEKAREDSIANAVALGMANQQNMNDTTAAVSTATSAPASETQQKLPLYAVAFQMPADAQNGDFKVVTNKAIYSFARQGGYLKRIEFKDVYKFAPKDSVKPQVVLFDGDANSLNIDLMLKNQAIVHSKDLTFSSEVKDSLVVTKDSAVLSLKVFPAGVQGTADSTGNAAESYLEYLYTFYPNEYHFGFRINFVNMSDYLYANNLDYTIAWNAQLTCQERNYQIERDMSTIYYMDNVEDVDNLDERKSAKKDFSSPLKWVGFKQQFFTSTLIAKSADFTTASLEVTVPAKTENTLLKTMTADLDFKLNDLNNSSFEMMMYVGPSQYKLLKGYDMKLERQVPLGWGFFLLQWCNRYMIIPIFNWLESYGISYGIIILILSLFIKLLVTPVNYKTYISSAKMRALKPEIEALGKRFPKADQNQDEMMKKQQATMALYKSAKASPMAGCIPALIQMPILIAMYRFFPSAYELRQQPFLWAEDLSAYDSILDLSFNIPLYGNHVSLFTLLMTISTIAYTYMNNKLMNPAAGSSDQQRMMKVMMYLMPIMFLFMFNSFSSGLTYYYLLINLITFAQNGIFMLTVNQDKLRAQLLANMKKPVKKSKWQQRMEEMVKQQQQQMAAKQGKK